MQTLQLLHNLFTGALVCISQKVSVAAYCMYNAGWGLYIGLSVYDIVKMHEG